MTNESTTLDRIAATLDEILVKLRKGSDRHQQLDESNAAAEEVRKDPFSNI